MLMLFAVAAHSEATGWGIENRGVPFYAGVGTVAWEGACYGMVRAEIEYMKMGLDKERPFSEVTSPIITQDYRDAADPVVRQINKTSNQIFIEQFAALAQDYASRGRDFEKEIYSAKSDDPYELAESLRGSGVSSDNPQVMIMRGDKSAHAVIVEDVDEDYETINYRIKDPNFPGERRLVRYNKLSGEFEGYPQYHSFQHDNTELPERNKRWFQELIKGASDPGNPRLPLWKENGTGKKIEVPPPTPSRALNNNISAATDPAVGGVRLYFDPAIVESESLGAADDRWEMLRDLTGALAEGEEMVLAQNSRELGLQAVSLKSILKASQRNVILPFNRIFGYVSFSGSDDIHILGTMDGEYEPLPLDILTVALDEIWREGHAPAISLDPDPVDVFGKQNVRLEEISDRNSATDFVKVMLEADYQMKTVFFSGEEWGIPGFKSTYDLYREATTFEVDGSQVRYWLFPRETSGADVFVIRRGNATVVFFESDVKVLTEMMKDAMSYSMSGRADPIDEEAARLFTAQYDAIAERWPVFRRLDSLFDAAKLAAVLRARGEKSPVLDEAASRKAARVEIPKTYDGLGPIWVEGTPVFIGGGCESSRRISAARFVEQPSVVLASLALSPHDENVYDVVLRIPGVMPIEGPVADAVDAGLRMDDAMNAIMLGRNDIALERMNRLVAEIPEGDTPDLFGALTYRALAKIGVGDPTGALSDAERITWENPTIMSLRGIIRMYGGDSEGAYRDAATAARLDTSRMILLNRATIELMTLRWKELEKSLVQLRKIAPGDPEVELLVHNFNAMKLGGIAKARERVAQYFQTPMSIMLAMENGQNLGMAGKHRDAAEQLELALRLAEEAGPAADQLYVKERAWLGLISLYEAIRRSSASDPSANAYGAFGYNSAVPEEEENRKNDYIDALIERRPEWVTSWLVKLGYGSRWRDESSPSEQVEAFEKAMRLDPKVDPLIEEVQLIVGADPRAFFGLDLVPKAIPRAPDQKEGLRRLKRLVGSLRPMFETGPALHYLNSVDHLANVMIIVGEVASEFGLSMNEEPDEKTKGKVAKEIMRRTGFDMASATGGMFLRDMLLRMPAPKDGAGLVEIQTLAKYWLPAVVDEAMSDLEELKGKGEPASMADLAKVSARARDKLRRAIKMIDVEWGSFPAANSASAVSNTLHIFYATTILGELGSDTTLDALGERAVAGSVNPGEYVKTSLAYVDRVLSSDKAATITMKAFARAMIGMMVGEAMNKVIFRIREEEPYVNHPYYNDEYSKESYEGEFAPESEASSEAESDTAHEAWEARVLAWDAAYRGALREHFGIHTVLKALPLESAMDVLMARNLLTVLEKVLPQFDASPEDSARTIRALMETRARLNLRLASMAD